MKYNDVIGIIDGKLETENPPYCSVCGEKTIRTSALYWLCPRLHGKLIQAKYKILQLETDIKWLQTHSPVQEIK